MSDDYILSYLLPWNFPLEQFSTTLLSVLLIFILFWSFYLFIGIFSLSVEIGFNYKSLLLYGPYDFIWFLHCSNIGKILFLVGILR
jgi:hypothetical protein